RSDEMTRLCAVALALGALSCGGPSPRNAALQAPDRPGAEMALLIEQYQADHAALERAYHIPLTGRYQSRMSSFYGEWEKKLASLDFAALSRDGQVDYLLLQNHLRQERAALDRSSKVDDHARELLPFAGMIT